MIEIDLQTLALAIGVITGPTALLLSVLNYIRDRAKLHVAVGINQIIQNAPQYDPQEPHILIQVTNVGRRPAYVTLVALLFPDGQSAVLSDILYNPKHAKEGGEPLQFICEQNGVHQLSRQWPGVYCIVRTSSGNHFRSSFLRTMPRGGEQVRFVDRLKLRAQAIWRHKWALKRRHLE